MKRHFAILFLASVVCLPTRATANAAVRSRGKGLVPTANSKASIPPRPKLIVAKTRYSVVSPVKPPNAPTRFYQWYLRKCSDEPLVTKSVSAAIINLIGDVLAQNFEAYLSGDALIFNFKRMITFFLCGLVYVGPFVHFWYDFLFRLGNTVQKKFQFSKWKIVLTQVFTDQTLGVGIYFPSYFYVFELLESLVFQRTPSLERGTKKCFGQLTELLVMQYRIFPITSAFNLTFIPPELRVLFSNTLSIFWNMYLCTLLAK
jgi:hypothetical protein